MAISLKRRESILETHKKNLKITDFEIECTYSIHSIVVGGDSVGLVILFKEDDVIDEKIDDICMVTAKFLAKYLED